MSVGLHLSHPRSVETAVVGGENDDGVLVKPLLFEPGDHLRHHVIDHHHEIAVGRKSRLAAELFGRQDRRMRRIEEKGLVLTLPGDVFERFARNPLQTLPMFEVGALRTAALQQEPLAVSGGPVRQRRHPVVLYIYIRWHVQRRRDAEEIVESPGHGTAVDRTGEIHLAVAHRPVPPQMPLADAGRRIALLREEGGDGAAVGGDQRRGVAVGNAALERRAESVTPRQNAVARGRADRRARMGVGEGHPFPAERVDGRSSNPRFFIQGRHVAVAHVVGQDKDDVGLRGTGQRRGQGGSRNERCTLVEFHHIRRN